MQGVVKLYDPETGFGVIEALISLYLAGLVGGDDSNLVAAGLDHHRAPPAADAAAEGSWHEG